MKQMDKKDLSKKAKIWFEKAKEWLKRAKEALKKLELKKKYELFKEKLPEDKKAYRKSYRSIFYHGNK